MNNAMIEMETFKGSFLVTFPIVSVRGWLAMTKPTQGRPVPELVSEIPYLNRVREALALPFDCTTAALNAYLTHSMLKNGHKLEETPPETFYFDIQYIQNLGNDYQRVDRAAQATEFGVYAHTSRKPMSQHVVSYPTEAQANAFLTGLSTNITDCFNGGVPVPQPNDDISAHKVQDFGEQVACFMHNVNMQMWDSDKTEGACGLYSIIVDAAKAFCAFHDAAMIGVTDYWDAMDWYETSDKYFDECIAEQVYPDAPAPVLRTNDNAPQEEGQSPHQEVRDQDHHPG
jgi:hypothetical protein